MSRHSSIVWAPPTPCQTGRNFRLFALYPTFGSATTVRQGLPCSLGHLGYVPSLITTTVSIAAYSRYFTIDWQASHSRGMVALTVTVFSGPPQVRLRYGPHPVSTLRPFRAAYLSGHPYRLPADFTLNEKLTW